MRRWAWLVAACMLLGGAGPAAAQSGTELYELGRRLKAFEAAWEHYTDPAARKRAAEIIDQVQPQFRTFQFAEACRTLDLATHALRSADPPTVNDQYFASLTALPESRVVDATAKELTVTVRPFYPVKGDVPQGLEVRLGFGDEPSVRAKPEKFPYTAKVPLPPPGDSPGLDRKLNFSVSIGTATRPYSVGVSQVARLAERVAALRKAAGGMGPGVRKHGGGEPPAPGTIEQATVKDRADLLGLLAGGGVWDTDLPAAALLADAEAMLNGKPFFTADKPGQFWMSVPAGGKKTAPLRVFIPKGLDPKKPVPVVVGLHGLGGSENLFFEGYGAGLAVKECEKRGWVFVATRSGFNFSSGPPVAAVLDELGKRYPLDPKRVFLVGHSMGSVQAVAVAQKNPGRFAAVALLGGGGIVTDAKAFAGVPVFVAAGEKDFGLEPARDLKKALTDAGVTGVTLKEYPGVEHLMIVREALPDVFAVFDKAGGK